MIYFMIFKPVNHLLFSNNTYFIDNLLIRARGYVTERGTKMSIPLNIIQNFAFLRLDWFFAWFR